MNIKSINRRNFIRNTSLGVLMVSIHPEIIFGSENAPIQEEHKWLNQVDLIENIKLQTSVALSEMKTFYHEKMEFPIVNEQKNEITFEVGNSTLTFVKIAVTENNPWYHFAFNIPENKLLKAREWQLKRTSLILTPRRSRDPDFPDDVRNFSHWNAHSLFFYDPAGNLLEHIARHDLNNAKPGSFTKDDILNISEIAFVVDDQQAMAKKFYDEFSLNVYPKNTSFWWAMGDENGLLLAIPKRLWGENTDNPKRFGIHPTEATVRGDFNRIFTSKTFPYLIKMNS